MASQYPGRQISRGQIEFLMLRDGVDGNGMEYVYIRTNSSTAPVIVNTADSYTDSNNHTYLDDDFLPLATVGSTNVECTDNPVGVDLDHQFEWIAVRDKGVANSDGVRAWTKYSGTMILWSRYGERGQDGDGVEYVFVRTANETVVPTISNNDPYTEGAVTKTYLDDDFCPMSSAGRCTDEPSGVNATYKCEWVAMRTKGSPDATGVRAWLPFDVNSQMSLWSKYATDGQDNDSIILTPPVLAMNNASGSQSWYTEYYTNIQLKIADTIIRPYYIDQLIIYNADGTRIYECHTTEVQLGTSDIYERTITEDYVDANAPVMFQYGLTKTRYDSEGMPRVRNGNFLTVNRFTASANPADSYLVEIYIDNSSHHYRAAGEPSLNIHGSASLSYTLSLATSVSFGTEGTDYVPLTVGSVTKNLVLQSQYIPRVWKSLQNNDNVNTYDSYKIHTNHLPSISGTGITGTYSTSGTAPNLSTSLSLSVDVATILGYTPVAPSALNDYLPKSGGTISYLNVPTFYLSITNSGNDTADQWIRFDDASGRNAALGIRRAIATYGPTYRYSVGGADYYYRLWHEGNAGTISSSWSCSTLTTASTITAGDNIYLAGKLLLHQGLGIYCLGSETYRRIYGCDSTNTSQEVHNRMTSFAMIPDNDADDAWQVRPRDGDFGSAYVTVLHGGNVGIGTNNPQARLHAHAALSGEVLRLSISEDYTAGHGPRITFYNSTSERLAAIDAVFHESNQGNYGDLCFGTRTSDSAGVTTKMTIRYDGNVGIGTTNPGYQLHVVGNGYFSSSLTAAGDIASYGSISAPYLGATIGASIGSASGANLAFLRPDANYFDATQTGGFFIWRVNNYSFGMELNTAGRLYTYAGYSTGSSNIMAGYNIGSGTYNIMTWTLASNHFGFEFPNLTDAYDGTHIPIYFGWRGGVYPLTIAANGCVGIHTTNPTYGLDVNASLHVTGNIVIEQTGGIYSVPASSGIRKIYGCDSSNGSYTQMASYAMIPDNDANDAWQVRPCNGTYTTAYVTVLHGGYVGIGTTSPVYKLDVSGVIHSTTGIFSDGYVTAGTASDIRLKENVNTLEREDAKRIVMGLRPVTFSWNSLAHGLCEKYEGDDIGFIAQEVQLLVPQAIGSIFNDYLRMDPTKFIAPLVSMAQSHESRLDAAERKIREQDNRIASLETENAELKARLNA